MNKKIFTKLRPMNKFLNISITILFILVTLYSCKKQHTNEVNDPYRMELKKHEIATNIFMTIPNYCQITKNEQGQSILFKNNESIQIQEGYMSNNFIKELASSTTIKILKQDSINGNYFVFFVDIDKKIGVIVKMKNSESTLFPDRFAGLNISHQAIVGNENIQILKSFESLFEVNKK